MPQGYRPSREALRVMLSDRRDFLVRVRCCRTRYYVPDDLIELFGDHPALLLEQKIRKCEDCGESAYLNVSLIYPTAAERAKIRVRRLVEIKTIKRPIWREVPG